MKNKIRLKKYLGLIGIAFICLAVIMAILNIYEYNVYTRNFNDKILKIIDGVLEKYPNVSEEEIVEILNNDSTTNKLQKYGIGLDEQAVLQENDMYFNRFLAINIGFIFLAVVILVLVFAIYNAKKDKAISDITKCIQEINKKNYSLNIDSITEGELSILKNEIYKTTIMLKEAAENSNMDKIKLKTSLEDISHQLKTPLTSILIMLDNLIDDENMDANTRCEFLRDIKREVVNINFFVQAILKLSKFDANTIKFIKEETDVKQIIDEAVKNVASLCDLRNISICIKEDKNAKIKCDFKWQVEAITNILKNCIDHSENNQKIIIEYEQNNVYTCIKIRDFGDGISKEDMPHIFERFYKGKNASSDSIGIGLALSKTIIEEDNGSINATSNENGTTFVIKYFSRIS